MASKVYMEPSSRQKERLLALCQQGRYAESEGVARHLATGFPKSGFAWHALGISLQQQGRAEEALSPMQRAAALLPVQAGVHHDLGNALTLLGRVIEAEASYRQALRLKPDFPEAHSNLGNTLTNLGRFNEAEASYRQALRLKPDYPEAYSDLIFSLNYSATHSPVCCLEEARNYGRSVAQNAAPRFFSWTCTKQPERLRVGLVSGDFLNHPVGYFLDGLLATINPAQVELIAYPTHHKTDKLSERLRFRCSAWKPIFGQTDESAAQMIHADGVHILFDLAGHTAHNRLPIFAWKPAPIQVSWLGYFATTGVAEIDYVLADETVLPQAQQEQFTESVWYLPDTRLCFTAPAVDIQVAPLPALSKGNITFACFQNLSKVGDQVLDAWGKILAALPEARLRIQSKQLRDPLVAEDLVQRLQHHGIEPHRLVLRGLMRRDAYLAAHGEVDIILDTFPYPGGTTTCEALWMGVPTLTLAGEGMLARQGAGLLNATGLAEWVATSQEDYVEKAIVLAGDLPKLATLRNRLRQQAMASPLFDAPRFARNFEAALWAMWQRWESRNNE